MIQRCLFRYNIINNHHGNQTPLFTHFNTKAAPFVHFAFCNNKSITKSLSNNQVIAYRNLSVNQIIAVSKSKLIWKCPNLHVEKRISLDSGHVFILLFSALFLQPWVGLELLTLACGLTRYVTFCDSLRHRHGVQTSAGAFGKSRMTTVCPQKTAP